jgi:hypothetical protein
VGDGSQINIWDDPWIPCSPNRKFATIKGNIVYNKVFDRKQHWKLSSVINKLKLQCSQKLIEMI